MARNENTEEKKGKRKLIPLLLILLAILLAAGTAAFLLLGDVFGGEGKDPTGESTLTTIPAGNWKIAWNVDRLDYIGKSEGGLSSREKDGSGFYNMMFAVDGEQIEFKTDDTRLMNRIDQMELVGLDVDENGVILDARKVEEVTGGILADNFYVDIVDGNLATCNSSKTMNGVSVALSLTENVGIYDVSGKGDFVGIAVEAIQAGDRIIVIQNPAGEITHIFVTERTVEMVIYWNIERMWDAETKRSTRQPDATGEYSFHLAGNGEQMTLRAKSAAIADLIDGQAARCFALKFDSEGYIVGVTPGWEAAGGGSFGSWYEVIKVENGFLYVQDLTAAAETRLPVQSAELAENVRIFDVSPTSEFVGKEINLYELKPNFTTHSLKNRDGQITHIFVIKRIGEGEIYWSMERKYDNNTKQTTRTPIGGFYYFDVVWNGGERATYKTDNKELANKIDSWAARCFGLKLNGDIIEDAYFPTDLLGGQSFGSWFYVTGIDGNTVHARQKDAATKEWKWGTDISAEMSEDCRIYNVTSYATVPGADTTLRVGDQIHGLRDLQGKLVYIMVVGGRYADSEMYWNIERKWDNENKVTTRVPEADGYYYFKLAVNGKHVTYKTKNREIATEVDSYAAKCFGLKLSGDVILDTYWTAQVTGGNSHGSWYEMVKIENNRLYVQDPNKPMIDRPIASNCKVFDVSGNGAYIGEPVKVSDIKEGNTLHSLMNDQNEVVIIYIIKTQPETEIYWNVERMWDATEKKSTRQPDADGYYNFLLAVNGEQKTYKTKDAALANTIDSYAAKCFGLKLSGDIIEKIYTTDESTGGQTLGSWYEMVKIEDNRLYVQDPNKPMVDAPIAKDCKIFNVSGTGADVGKPMALKDLTKDSTLHSLRNHKGEVIVIFVVKYVAAAGDVDDFPPHNHAIAEGVGESLTWLPWTSAIQMPKEAGNYFLTTDVSISTLIELTDCNINICLNGHSITCDGVTSGDRIYSLKNGAELSICDCTAKEEGGVYTAGKITGSSYAAINTNGAGIFNLYGGIITGNDTSFSPVTLWSNGVFNMYGGEISGNKAAANGGAVAVGKDAVANIYGGKIVNNTATGNGDALYFSPAGKGSVTLAGGEVQGSVYIENTNKLTLTGKPVVTANASGVGLYLADSGKLTADALEEGASILIGMKTPDVFTNGTTEASDAAFAAYFKADAEDNTIVEKDGALAIELPASTHIHKLANGVGEDIEFNEWTATDSLPAFGNWYLVNNVTLTSTLVPSGELNLCLHGKTISIAGAADWQDRTFKLDNAYALNICDCSAKTESGVYTAGKITGANNTAIVLNNNGAVVNLYDGMITGNTGKPAVMMWSKSTFNMYGGEISDNNGGTDAGAGVQVGKNSYFNMYGGKISGNTTSGAGKDVYVNNDGAGTGASKMTGGIIDGQLYVAKTAKMTIGGTAVVKATATDATGLYLPSGATVKADALESGASITVSMATPGVFTDGTATASDEAFATYFTSKDPAYSVSVDNGALTLGTGGSVTPPQPEEHTHTGYVGEGQTWIKWGDDEDEKTSMPLDSGYYVLESDINMSASAAFTAAADVHICLNGKTVTAPADGRIYRIANGANVTICDCTAKTVSGTYTAGKLIPGKGTAALAGLFWKDGVSAMNSFTLVDGIVDGTGKTEMTQLFQSGTGNATINIQGGEIRNCATTDNMIDVVTGNLNISGGVITDNTPAAGAYEICVGEKTGTVVISGGKIDGTVAVVQTAASNTHKLTLSGAPKIQNLYLVTGANLVNVEAMETGASVAVSMATPGAFTSGTTAASDEAFAAYFTSKDSAYSVTAEEGALKLTEGGTTPPAVHTDHDGLVWEKWEKTDSLPTEDGNYYLSADVSLSQYAVPKANSNVHLCLCGHNVTVTNSTASMDRILKLDNACTYSIYDCTASGSGDTYKAGKLYGASGGAIVFNSAATVNLYDGIITDNNTTSNGGAVIMWSSSIFNMEGGQIRNNTTTVNGGAVNVGGLATFNMKGGEIIGNTAKNGGAVYNSNGGKLSITGGQIKNNTAENGGAIYLTGSSSKILIQGCTITENKATSSGASAVALYDSAKATLKDVTITGNTNGVSNGYTGGIYMIGNNNKLTLSGKVVIQNNTDSGGREYNILLQNSYNAANGAAITVDGLTAGSNLTYQFRNGNGVTPATTAAEMLVLANGADQTTWDKDWILCNDNAKQVDLVEGVFVFHEHKHTTDAPETVWNNWNQATTMPNIGGHYVLTCDVDMAAAVEVGAAEDIVICLNGYTVTGPTTGNNARIYRLSNGASLTICDCTAKTENGVYTAGKLIPKSNVVGGGMVGLFSNQSSAVSFTLEDGIIDGSQITGTAPQGVIYSNSTADINIKGGKVIGCDTTNNNGDAVTLLSGELNISGGEIQGDIYVTNGSKFGATNPGKVNLSGAPKITANADGKGLYLENDSKISATDLKDGASIVIGMKTPGAFTDGTATDSDAAFAENFIADTEGYVIKADATGALVLKLWEHEDHNGLTWSKWEKTDSLPTESGNYYLTGDVTLSIMAVPKEGSTVNLCLCGHNVTVTNSTSTNDRILKLDSACTYSIYDCTVSGSGDTYKAGKLYGADGGAIVFNSAATVNLYDGIITDNSTTSNGGAVIMWSSSIFNMEGGQIRNNTTTVNGGAVNVGGLATFNMKGGEILNNKAANGGAIYMSAGAKLNITGGTVKSNTAADGGAIYMSAGAKLNITGGTVKSNTATGKGGALYTAGAATINVQDVAISNNTAQNAAIYLSWVNGSSSKCIATLKNVTMEENKASAVGTAIYGAGFADIRLDSCTIRNNVQTGTGTSQGAICLGSADSMLTLSGKMIVDNNKQGTVENNIYIAGYGATKPVIIRINGLTAGTSMSYKTTSSAGITTAAQVLTLASGGTQSTWDPTWITCDDNGKGITYTGGVFGFAS